MAVKQLRQLQMKQYIREEGPKAHKKKAGTPTMGGVLIVASIVIPTLLWADLRIVRVAGGFRAVAFGAIGFVDDYNKVYKQRNLGLTARENLVFRFFSLIAASRCCCWLRTASIPRS